MSTKSLSLNIILLLCTFALWPIKATPVSNVQNNATGRMAIMDNDWSSTGFIPYLMALDAGIDVLALTTCKDSRAPMPLLHFLEHWLTCCSQGTGGSWQPQLTLHALATLEAGNLSCIPVVPGALYPLIQTYDRFQAWEAVHGSLYWQGAFAPENVTAEALGSDPTGGDPNRIVASAFVEGYPTTKADTTTNAASFMVDMVHKYPDQVSIYAAGALTNVALAVRMDPNFASLAKELVVMGGYVDDNLLQADGSLLQSDINSDVGHLSSSLPR